MNAHVNSNLCPRCGAPIPADAPQGLCPKCVLSGAATLTGGESAPVLRHNPPELETVRAAFPQLEILDLIGTGGMGIVYRARQPKLDRIVALKLLPEVLGRHPAFVERFDREARVLARLNHPNIVTVYDFGQAAEFCYLLMEYVDGLNLRQAMQAGRFSPPEALAIVPRICEALQFAHEQGVLHRDIKPENILLDTHGRVKIADFGIAKLLDAAQSEIALTGTGATLGTPHYMAPEQIEHPQDVDQRADIYSLGVVFYEMLTGELPLGRFPPPSQKTPVFQFLRCQGRPEDVARELAQEFFSRLLSRGGVAGADPDRGRFRCFLLGALKHFLSDLRDQERRLKRGGGQLPESLEAPSPSDTADAAPGLQVPDPAAPVPDTFFDRQWALNVMNRALRAAQQEFATHRKTQHFEVLKPWLVGTTAALPQAEAAQRLGLSEGAVKVAIHRLRKRFRELVRAEIAQTVPEPAELDTELRYLLEVLAQS
ncbi:MAG: hypothetical protein FJ387_12855 [Verrucomicrobia bacterium]|nr:hypothetical protein [Verrucomicrobiota bacterium]